MPKFYIQLGIPMYKGKIILRENRTMEDIYDYFDRYDHLICKGDKDKLYFRTRFTYAIIYRGIAFLSIIKGELKVTDHKITIIQRINLTTLFAVLVGIYVFITYDVHVIGYIFAGYFTLFTILFHRARYKQIDEVRKETQIYLNQKPLINTTHI